MEAMNKDFIIERLESFALYLAGWDYGEGSPIRPEVIDLCKTVYLKFADLSLEVTVSPDTSGSIWITFSKGSLSFVVLAGEDLALYASLEKSKRNHVKCVKVWSGVTLPEIERLLPKELGLARVHQGLWGRLKQHLCRAWNACLPNTIDIHWIMVLGRLGVTPLGISTDYDGWGGYSENPEKAYRPKFSLLEIQWHGKDYTGFRGKLLGYKLEYQTEFVDLDSDDDEAEGETWYWHVISILFYDFWFEATGPINLKLAVDV